MIYYCLLAIVLPSTYVVLILYILRKWLQQTVPDFPLDYSEKIPRLSIIIAVRNEERHILQCLNSLLANRDFEKINPEIIIIDDHSTDNTVGLVKSLNSPNIICLSLEQNPSKPIKYAYKKAALNLGLGKAKGEYIVQLDGDVWVGKNYLNFVCASIKNQKSDFIAGPVQLTGPNTLFGNFQILDFMGMMGLTQAGIFSGKWYMANGANMVYKKNLIEFEEDKRASGDDISAIQTIADNHGHVSFMKSEGAIVYTHCVNDLTSFYRQRIRWATKNKFVKNNWMVVVMAIPFLNALLLFSYFPMLWIIPKTYVLLLVLFHLFMHLSVDFLYLKELNKFFKVKKVFKYFFLAKIYNAVYLVVIGSASFFIKKYKWKDRLVE